jgi:single stranded DNA-binding protein
LAVNLVVFQGNLGQPPKTIKTRRGEVAVILNLACNESYTDTKGERKEAATWAGVACYGKVAEYVLDVLQLVPGDEVLVEGKLNSYSQEDRGARRSVLQVVAKAVRPLKKSNDRPEKHYRDEYPPPRPDDDEIPF